MSVKKVCGIIGLVVAVGAIAYAISKRETIKLLLQKYDLRVQDDAQINEG